MNILDDLAAFFEEHRGCGELDATVTPLSGKGARAVLARLRCDVAIVRTVDPAPCG